MPSSRQKRIVRIALFCALPLINIGAVAGYFSGLVSAAGVRCRRWRKKIGGWAERSTGMRKLGLWCAGTDDCEFSLVY